MKRKKKNGNTPMVLLPLSFLLSNVAANSKNKETFSSLFFSCRQRSKLIFRVTRKALRGFPSSYRKYLALAGGCDHAEDKSGTLRIYLPLQNTLPMVACSEVTGQQADFAPDGRKRSGLQKGTTRNWGVRNHLLVVAYVMSRKAVETVCKYSNLKM